MIEEYYSPHDIVFSREQVIWLICHYDLLGDGKYPPNPNGSNYIDPGIPSQRAKTNGGFEIPAQIFSELDIRLKACKFGIHDDGETLKHEIREGLDEFDRLSPAAKSALNYCSGWRRRAVAYSTWCALRNYENKRVVKVRYTTTTIRIS